ncbi:pullulanase-type alpha-1,6-glucosidase [Nocardiopsis arvandica]|uniref:Pullulanase-type alpha-1,6-glucosidase n=1 Tax=Nocardiopsis sinuspersici TaxID=501010 RepID=A0A7Z0BK49_9ACTN|nr:pullulanase-type alpha-1,6-glucosidase [Nocardiopsis sinuspersici]NYH52112.1 pullulanase-type alpha-1,6-glucosidase [Nocardiopsis sinuspersici]
MRPPHTRSERPPPGTGPGAVRAVVAGLVATALALPLLGASAAALPAPAEPAGQAVGADLTEQRAHWIDRTTVLWPGDLDPEHTYALVASRDAGLDVSGGELGGTYETLDLTADPDGPTEDQRAAWPHLADLSALDVGRVNGPRLRTALTGRLAVVERDGDGAVVAATGVQIPGVLDDVYADAADADLGAVWDARGRPTISLWAPTARSVSLELYDDSASDTPRTVRMRQDHRTGVWSVRGRDDWAGRFYTFDVRVFSPYADGGRGAVVDNRVTDPYSVSLSTDSARSHLVDPGDPDLAPEGWSDLAKPAAVPPEAASVYELHVRDHSISDDTVPAGLRGTFAAFAQPGSDGMRELAALAEDGMDYVHLLPAFDVGSVPEDPADRSEPACDLDSFESDSEEQQACIARTRGEDAFNWGYDPYHYTVPEGSYSTDPDGATRVDEFRQMVGGLNGAGLRVVMDVVYNHTHQAGQDEHSVLDRIVPGYYHRLGADGGVATSTCCPNTAPEHLMMGKLVVDSVTTWAREYKVDGFRFDLMGHHPKQNMLDVRAALDELTLEEDGVDGSSVLLYGEGWDFGEVADDARFEQATQANMAGTGIGTFNDRLRDAVRGGGPFDADPRVQGFGSGLYTDPNGSPANGTGEEQLARLLGYQDLVKVGLTGNLRDYRFTASSGEETTGWEVDYNGAPAGYNLDPGEAVTYVDAHDNETLYDALAYKLPPDTPMEDRVRMQALSLGTAAFGQGTLFVHAGSERLRSKSLDRNSYDSGDWFNRLEWDCAGGNNFGAGLPPAWDNEDKWDYARPLLADPALVADCAAVEDARERFGEMLRIRESTPAFSLGTAEEVQDRLSFPTSGADELPGVITMRVDTTGLEGGWSSVTVVFNATPETVGQEVDALAGGDVDLHPVQAESADEVVRESSFDPDTGALEVPPRTVAVFVED